MKKSENKIEIKEFIPIDFDLYQLEGKVEEVIQRLKDIPNKVKEKVEIFRKYYEELGKPDYIKDVKESNTKLLSCHRFEIDISYSHDDTNVSIQGYRWETDEEFNTRLDKQKKDKLNAQKAAKTRKKNQEEEELKLFNKLKKKYGIQ